MTAARHDALALTDYQLRAIQRAAAALPPATRGDFLAHVAAQLSGQPSDDAVQAAINVVLDRAAALRMIE
jgi:hypothetical protein